MGSAKEKIVKTENNNLMSKGEYGGCVLYLCMNIEQ
jgi:hypothetical protein